MVISPDLKTIKILRQEKEWSAKRLVREFSEAAASIYTDAIFCNGPYVCTYVRPRKVGYLELMVTERAEN